MKRRAFLKGVLGMCVVPSLPVVPDIRQISNGVCTAPGYPVNIEYMQNALIRWANKRVPQYAWISQEFREKKYDWGRRVGVAIFVTYDANKCEVLS